MFVHTKKLHPFDTMIPQTLNCIYVLLRTCRKPLSVSSAAATTLTAAMTAAAAAAVVRH
jgi:hypothetical protein